MTDVPAPSPSTSRQPRRWSFSSSGIARGALPEKVDVPDDTIHAAIFFPEGCPDPADVAESIVPKLLAYERMASVPDPASQSCRMLPTIDPTRLVRHMVVHYDERQELYDNELRELFEIPVTTGRDGLPWWEFVILENNGKAESVLVMRIHHALADGFSILALVQEFVTFADGSPLRDIVPASLQAKPDRPKLSFFTMVYRTFAAIGKVLAVPSIGNDDPTIFSKHIRRGMVRSEQCVYVVRCHVFFQRFLKRRGRSCRRSRGRSRRGPHYCCWYRQSHQTCFSRCLSVLSPLYSTPNSFRSTRTTGRYIDSNLFLLTL